MAWLTSKGFATPRYAFERARLRRRAPQSDGGGCNSRHSKKTLGTDEKTGACYPAGQARNLYSRKK